jgi:hypothetical protein
VRFGEDGGGERSPVGEGPPVEEVVESGQPEALDGGVGGIVEMSMDH